MDDAAVGGGAIVPVVPGMAAAGEEAGQDSTEKIMEYQRREYALLSQLARRDREMQELQRHAGEAAHAYLDTRKDSLNNAYVDPAVNVEIAMLRQRLKEKDVELDRLKDESTHATFQPHSIQGQKLLRKCTHLLEENAELGRQLGEERMQSLRIKIALERRKRAQLRARISDFDQSAEQIDAENERMQKRIADLGKCLKEARTDIDVTKKMIDDFKSGKKRPREKNPDADIAVAAAAPVAVPVAATETSSTSKRSRKEKS